MNFLHSRFHLEDGGSVCIDLHGAVANVRVMDDVNFQRYRSGKTHECFGGDHRESHAIICPPHGGAWNVVIDLDAGEVEASISVIH